MPSCLPPECLNLIVNDLAENNELDCLAALLVVSKSVCQITLPYIYSNPFRLLEQTVTGQGAVVRFRQLVRLLLTTSVPCDEYSDLLKAMYEIDDYRLNDSTPSRPLQIKYLEYLLHFDLTQDLVTLTSPECGTLDSFPRLRQYVEQHALKQEYRVMLNGIPFDWSEMSVWSTDNLIFSYLNMVLRRELSWVLCRPILNQLQSIAIPVSFLGRYLDNVDQLSSLQSIVFVLDELLYPRYSLFDDMTEENIEKGRILREKRAKRLDSVVDFVRIHTCRFRGVLKLAGCPPNATAWKYWTQICPKEYMERIIACLEPMLHPTELVNENWRHFLAHYHETDLGHVECIRLTNPSKAWYGCALSDPDFLRRCRTLRRLEAPLLGPQILKKSAIVTDIVSLPPLEVVRLRQFKNPFGDDLLKQWEPFSNERLDSIAQAFGPSLKVLTIEGDTWTTQQPTLRLGYHWHLPAIYELNFDMLSELVDVDPTFMDRCPTLRVLSLSDARVLYQSRAITTLQPARLPMLFVLRLIGTPALSFNPDTLHSTKELRFLCLEHTGNGHISYVPSVTELKEAEHSLVQDTEKRTSEPSFQQAEPGQYGFEWLPRSRWSWDWYLPCLTCILFTGEFALRFQFRMLQGCPSVVSLSLNIISTSEEPVVRELTEADFTIDPSVKHPSFEQHPGNQSLLSSLVNKGQDDWSLQDIESALQIVSMESLNAVKGYCANWSHRRIVQPFMYRRHGGSGPPPLVLPEGVDDTPSPPWNSSCVRLLFFAHDQIEAHRATLEYLDHPDPAMALRKEMKGRKSLVHSVLKQMKEAPLLRQGVVTLIRRLLADHHDLNEFHHTALTEKTRLRVPSLQMLDIHGFRISCPVLKIMLGDVFRNVHKLREMFCTGFTLLQWLQTTQRMPWLLRAESTRVLGAEVLPIEALPESLLTTKVQYFFDDRECSFAE